MTCAKSCNILTCKYGCERIFLYTFILDPGTLSISIYIVHWYTSSDGMAQIKQIYIDLFYIYKYIIYIYLCRQIYIYISFKRIKG